VRKNKIKSRNKYEKKAELNGIEQHDLSAVMNGLEKRWQWINR